MPTEAQRLLDKIHAMSQGESFKDADIKTFEIEMLVNVLPEISDAGEDHIRVGEVGSISYYELLNISTDADDATIRRAYRALTIKTHPDKTGTGGELFRKVTDAYQVLSNANKKFDYNCAIQDSLLKTKAAKKATEEQAKFKRKQEKYQAEQAEEKRAKEKAMKVVAADAKEAAEQKRKDIFIDRVTQAKSSSDLEKILSEIGMAQHENDNDVLEKIAEHNHANLSVLEKVWEQATSPDVLKAVVSASYGLNETDGNSLREKITTDSDATYGALGLVVDMSGKGSNAVMSGQILHNLLHHPKISFTPTLNIAKGNKGYGISIAITTANITSDALTQAAKLASNPKASQFISNHPKALQTHGLSAQTIADEEKTRKYRAVKKTRCGQKKQSERYSFTLPKLSSSKIALTSSIAVGMGGVALIAIGITSLVASHGVLGPLSVLAFYKGIAMLKVAAGLSIGGGAIATGASVKMFKSVNKKDRKQKKIKNEQTESATPSSLKTIDKFG